MKQLLAFTQGVNHPSARLRIAAYAEHFLRRDWHLRMHHFDSGMGKAQPRAASRWQHATRRLHRGWQTARAIAALRRLRPDEPVIVSRELPVSRQPFLKAQNPMVLDIDDALYLGPGRERLLELCRRAQVVVCGNSALARELAPFSRRCVVIPTVVDAERFHVRTDFRLNGPLRVGWLGSSMSIEQTLLPWLGVLGEIRRQVSFELVVISDEPPSFLRGVGWSRFLKWSPAVEGSIADHMDVGIMPLQDNPYQAAKCGAKLVQYMAAGLPVVATPIGVNRDIVVDGVTGCLAVQPDDWGRAIHHLAGQEKLRAAFGRAGRELVVRNYSIARWADRWVDLLNELARQLD
ncbi:MAG: glycosyltransferase family 4 protein [Verrucomicrobiia bacterium]|jgi:glycosyltransferase involved in cell wall biosynthesis